GPLAMGRVGDVVIENARVRYTLRSGAESATVIGAPAGGVIDATLQGGPRIDGLKEFLPLLNFAGLQIDTLVIVQAGGSEAIARGGFHPVRVGLTDAALPGLFQPPRLHGVVEYRLGGSDDVLRMSICALPDVPALMPTPAIGGYASVGGSGEVLVPGAGVL